MSGMYYVRILITEDGRLRKFGPVQEGQAGVGDDCPACGWSIKVGDYTALVPLGPGDDPEEQAKAREGRYFNASAVQVHWSCATGEVE